MDNKLLFTWSENMSCGIPILDDQHRGIISLINSLYFLPGCRSSSFIIDETVLLLDQYIKLHSYTEEYILQHFQYPDFEAHQSEHIRQIKKMSDLRIDDTLNAQELAKCLIEVFAFHIESVDRKYTEFIKDAIIKEGM